MPQTPSKEQCDREYWRLRRTTQKAVPWPPNPLKTAWVLGMAVLLLLSAALLLWACSSVPVPTHDQVCEADAVARKLRALAHPDGGL
jgi:hypothetical protein